MVLQHLSSSSSVTAAAAAASTFGSVVISSSLSLSLSLSFRNVVTRAATARTVTTVTDNNNNNNNKFSLCNENNNNNDKKKTMSHASSTRAYCTGIAIATTATFPKDIIISNTSITTNLSLVSSFPLSCHRNFSSSSSSSSKDTQQQEETTTTIDTIQRQLDNFQELFVEARLCIEDMTESIGTTYFEEDAEAAQEAVDDAVKAFETLLANIDNLEEKNRILRSNGLKVEQLKGELQMAFQENDDGHGH